MAKKRYFLALISTLLTGMLTGSSLAHDNVVVIPLLGGSQAFGNATPGDVLQGKTFSGNAGGPVSGTMVNNEAVTITPTSSNQTIAAGYHNGSGTVSGDADLISANIRSGSIIFGVNGNTNVVNTSGGNAISGDMLSGKTAYVKGAQVTGNIAVETLSDANDTISAGYYTATTLSAIDADLATANIKSDATIFGITGDPNVVDTSDGDAMAGDILSGRTAYVNGAQVTGNIANRTLSDANDTVLAGHYTATTLSTVDTDLATANIKSGATIFGVAGDPNVVDTSSGDAVAADIANNKVAWVDGVEVTGSAALISQPAPVARTGQTPTVPFAAPAGSDGTLQKGVTWPNPRFTDNGDGTVTDNLTGLVWLQEADCRDTVGSVDKGDGTLIWANALTWSNNLATGDCGLTGSHSAGDWRLPNWNELHSLIDARYNNPALSDSAGTAQASNGNPFTNIVSNFYWSSTTCAFDLTYAWQVYLSTGSITGRDKAGGYYVLPVRN